MPDSTVISIHDWPVEKSRQICAQLSNVSFGVNSKPLLDGMDLTIRKGGVTTLLGPNGAGKTLTLRILARLLKPTNGTVRECGLESKDISLVFQKPILLRRSAEANILHALKLFGTPRAQRPLVAQQLLHSADLSHLAKRPARKLSGGEQQRLAMVRALASKPKMLLLDEPTASLDPRATASIEDMISHITNSGTKVVLVTHDIGQAKRLSSEVVFLNLGFVTEQTEAKTFFKQPQSAEAAAYIDGQLLI